VRAVKVSGTRRLTFAAPGPKSCGVSNRKGLSFQ
jgi:hypothetical protein